MAEKSFHIKSEADKQTIIVEYQETATLMTTKRWNYEPESDKMIGDGLREELQELLLRPELEAKHIDIEKLTYISSEDIIERFLHADNLRIVVEEDAEEVDVVTSAEIDDEDCLVSEELAEVYLKQGLKEQAKETYRKLSLLNPEKSIYFAEIIAKIDSNN